MNYIHKVTQKKISTTGKHKKNCSRVMSELNSKGTRNKEWTKKRNEGKNSLLDVTAFFNGVYYFKWNHIHTNSYTQLEEREKTYEKYKLLINGGGKGRDREINSIYVQLD